MNELSTKEYWGQQYKLTGNNVYSRTKMLFSYSLQNFEYFQILKRFVKPTDYTICELGCSPGSYLIKANKLFGIFPRSSRDRFPWGPGLAGDRFLCPPVAWTCRKKWSCPQRPD